MTARRHTIQEALTAIFANAQPLGSESILLTEARGRILAEDVTADRDQPPFDRVMMDGYAVKSNDVSEPPVTLDVVGELAAGAVPMQVVQRGQAIRIMTGAALPDGADAVQMQENTTRTANAVQINKTVFAGQHVAPRGEELKKGAVAVAAGRLLTTARLGVCWSLGASEVAVYRRPQVAILTTGDELVELTATPGPTQIRDSNRATIGDLITRAGGVVVQSDIVADDIPTIRRAVRGALERADVLIMNGGISAGDYDFVAECLAAEGVRQTFHKVHMKPGKPLWYGVTDKCCVFGLPGNPVSSFVTARVFAVPLIRHLAGHRNPHDPRVMLPLTEPFGGTGGRPTFQPAAISWGVGVRLISTRGSGDQANASFGTCLAFLPADHPAFDIGDEVEVLLDEEALHS